MTNEALLAKIEDVRAVRDRFTASAKRTSSEGRVDDLTRALKLAQESSKELAQLHSERIARGLEIPSNA
ncbi:MULTISPECIES: hypothetical protein [Rhodococcus]|uniref:hypothetical protein n=1 Tax=Rhodococcus TaxID=1827 RepID=UPI0007AE7C9A|nr:MULTISPECIES: hypothetical protein [Rhodococcus]KZL33168.1 hypothetical protein A3852_12795 [Rhodococcus qingshengii]MCE4161675.1 hypothetical protein [Rhodococcus sp. Ni2]